MILVTVLLVRPVYLRYSCIKKQRDQCQRLGALSRCHMMSLNPILVIEIFYCWGIDFMGSFPPLLCTFTFSSCGLYVSKWVEAMSCQTNDNKTIVKFLKENVLSRFGTPRAIISDQGTHFCNRSLNMV